MICDPSAGSSTFSRPSRLASVGKEQPIPVAGKAGLDAMIATKLLELRIHLSRVSAHDRRSAMGEDGSEDARFPAPPELFNDRGVADSRAILFANH